MRQEFLKNICTSIGLYCCIFFFVGNFCQAQHDVLLNIIGSDGSNEIKQQEIDSFFLANDKEMSPILLADCYHDVASKWYYDQWWTTGAESDIQNAIDFTKKSLDIKTELSFLEEGSLEKTAYNLGTFHFFKGDLYNALDSYRYLADNGKVPETIQDAKLELGKLFKTLGDFYKALGQFTDIITFYNDSAQTDSGSLNLLDAYIERAETYYFIDNSEFDDEIRSDLKKADSLIERADQMEVHFRKNRINQFKGNRFLEIGDYDRAIAFHKSVLADSLNLFPGELSRVYNSVAFSQIKKRDFNQAITSLNQAISKDDNYSSPYENLGDLYFGQNEFEKGLYQYQKAIVYATDKNREIKYDGLLLAEDFELASDKILLLNHIVTKANGWLRYYAFDENKDHLEDALKTFSLADQLVDIIRFESTENQSKLFWREKGSSLYLKAVEVSYLLDRPADAYYFMERNKALLLLEDVSNEMAKEIAQLPDSVAKREFDLKRSILLAENELQLALEVPKERLDALRTKIYDHKRLFDQFIASLKVSFPEYAKLKKNVAVLPYPAFKANYISKDELVLQYILNDEQGYGLLTATDHTQFFKLEDVEALNAKIISLYGQLTDLTTDRNKMTAFNTLSYQVFRDLVPESVYDAIKGKKLTLVTDYLLQQIPFEAFVVNDDNGTFLIEDTEINYAYSMSYLDAKKQVNNHPEKEFFGIAPVQFASLGLPELLFSGSEVGEAEKLFSGKVALNQEATKASFLENEADSRIVHLSTHADIGEGMDPWIAFSDEKMFLNEIYATKNQAEMVVLSACNTSIGELKKGEGAMSLARGFFHSGAKSVVSSLWSTNDKSSKELMVAFYKGLDKGLSKSAAMRKAKIDYIEKYRETAISPAYWSALIVIGDNSPISSSGNPYSLWLWALLGILISLGLYFIYNKIKVRSRKSI